MKEKELLVTESNLDGNLVTLKLVEKGGESTGRWLSLVLEVYSYNDSTFSTQIYFDNISSDSLNDLSNDIFNLSQLAKTMEKAHSKL